MKLASPETELTAEQYVAQGYQRLLTFEVNGGGFSLFGGEPADVFLTAYGLMEFNDMARVYPVDEKLIDRTARWLLGQQSYNGTWGERGYSEHWQIQSQVATTAYITWALIQAGYDEDEGVAQAIDYIREFAPQETDPYSLALAANALAAYDAKDTGTRALVDRLYEMRETGDGQVYWSIGGSSYMGATGTSGSIETTALAAMALMQTGAYPEAVGDALSYLVQSKDSWGTWSTTQATILSLKALLMASETTGEVSKPAIVRISLNGEQAQEVTIGEENADAVHLVAFTQGFAPTGTNQVTIELQGGENLMYQVSTRYYLPWRLVPRETGDRQTMTIDLVYDRTALAVNDTVTVDVDVTLNQEGVVRMGLIDLGVPPGFSVMEEDLSLLVEKEMISRYELTGRQIIIYLENFSSEKPLRFSYRLLARFPLRAQTPPTVAYDYYNPSQVSVQAPLEVTVEP